MKITKLVNAAILYDAHIYVGRRHSIIQQTHPDIPLLRLGIQGFVTDEGDFLDRAQAKVVARNSGQVPFEFDYVLTSEDLW